MIDINTNSTDTIDAISAQMAIVLHGTNKETIAGATLHNVTNGRYETGRYKSIDAITSLFNSVTTSHQLNMQFTPDNVLMENTQWLIFYERAHKSTMFIRYNNTLTIDVHYPCLIYIVDKINKQLYVRASAVSTRPTPKTICYHAPLMNISKSGLVCLGSATMPSDINTQELHKISACVTNSNFTHTNHDHTLHIQGKKSVNTIDQLRFYQQLKGKKIKASDMVRTGSLNDFITEVIYNDK